METCKFNISWVGKCSNPVFNSEYCEIHFNMMCCVCKTAQATHSCSETFTFVCGAPLCDACKDLHHPEPEKPIKSKGLINKYIITKADGSPVDPNAEYFVLRLDKHQKDKKFYSACRRTIHVFAILIEDHLPELAKDLTEKYKLNLQ